MNFVGRVISSVSTTVTEFYKDINPATLSGAIDIVVIEDEAGELACSPFHVRFGKLQLLRPQEKTVEISLNGKVIPLQMKVGDAGEAFFVVETKGIPKEGYGTSPIALKPEKNDEFEMDELFLTASHSSVNDKFLSQELLTDKETEPSNNVTETAMASSYLSSGKAATLESYEYDISRINKSEATHNQVEILDRYGLSPPKPNGLDWSWEWGEMPIRSEPLPASAVSAMVGKSDLASNVPEATSSFREIGNGSSTSKQVSSEVNDEKLKSSGRNGTAKALSSSEPLDDSNTFLKAIVSEHYVKTHLFDIKFPSESHGKLHLDISLCGNCRLASTDDHESMVHIFEKHKLLHKTFCEDLNLFMNPEVVLRIDNKYMPVNFAFPILLSLSAYEMLPSKAEWKAWLLSQSQSINKSASRKSYSSFSTSFKTWFGGGKGKKVEILSSSASNTEPNEPIEQAAVLEQLNRPEPIGRKVEKNLNYVKSLRLTSEQLKGLNLKEGPNDIVFSVASQLQGMATCSARIFKWKNTVKIVISDIDGTITKSDALGHLFTMVGKDWTQVGVANLYTSIKQNGYEILYLTSRPIGQAQSTRSYLKSVDQNSFQLPDGPVIMSPDRLFTAIHREMIMRKPEEFKIAALKDIRKLFRGQKPGESPFYAGFGNRITDTVSYKSVEIPASRIFTVNAQGEISLELSTGFKSSYLKLREIVDQIFPAIINVTHFETPFNDFNYWRSPPAIVSLPDIANSNANSNILAPSSSSALKPNDKSSAKNSTPTASSSPLTSKKDNK